MDEALTLPEAVLAAAATATATPIPQLHIDNATAWRNFTLWTAQHLGMAVNMSKLAPSLEDLVLAGPRMMLKLGRLGGSFISFPDAIDSFGQRYVPDSTEINVFSTSAKVVSSVGTSVQSTSSSSSASILAAASSAAAAATVKDPKITSRISAESARSLGSVFGYATSKWALCCIAMALILNRTAIFAAPRRRLRLRWFSRLILRIPPIIALLWQARRLLQSIQCQTSPNFAELRWGNTTKSSDLMFYSGNPFFHGVSSTLLFGATDQESCHSVKMIPWRDGQEQHELVGSLSRLWPLFLTFCVSQFVEVLSCTVQGRPLAAETGTTLFEHSLAFAEAEAAIGSQLGWSLFTKSGAAASAESGPAIAVTRAMIMSRVNTPPEVLVIALLSAMGHASSHVLACFDVQRKYRLFSTGFWGLCFMASIGWSIAHFSIYDPSSQGLLRYPTISIIGFIPHILILTGISVCAAIYFIALTLSAFAAPTGGNNAEQLSFRQRFTVAHNNMQANLSLADIRIRREMDFYTALLRAGFYAITMASEAVYLNEDHRINLKPHTWLDEERMKEIESIKMQWLASGIPGSRYDESDTIGLVPVKEGESAATSGYAREKAAQQINKLINPTRKIPNGVGAAERTSRWIMAIDYIVSILRLVAMTWALCAVKTMALIGWRNPPRWLKELSQRPKVATPESKDTRQEQYQRAGTNADILAPGGGKPFFYVPRNDRVDVENLLRRRMTGEGSENNRPIEEAVDSMLYSYFLRNGWWGGNDSSADYIPPEHHENESDWDTTSVISSTETAPSVDGWETDPEPNSDNESLASGQRTPTQSDPRPMNFADAVRASREPTPAVDTPMAPSDLARLLHPQTPEDREEALALSAHLASDKILTRSSFKQLLARQRAQLLLTSTRGSYPHPGHLQKLTPEEEVRRLEQVLLSRRRIAGAVPTKEKGEGAGAEWATGAAGMGENGPQCVVCQCAPRTIIVWPCRCLSLCDECRVSLAMNNFDKCVCCRRDVFSFSRIYVP
ncbi:hypothetical protein QBC38DRAFT_470375 [Podospora fimiseda]|uniref:Ubiquitin-protein ligase n=1 Tax=Podospora fimiseda TaxID=252190 RepID=A0AAN7H3K7_9PEZI|nr:hypothetical protein QBC38DRAFT_470375 [Podospora fimiseda]